MNTIASKIVGILFIGTPHYESSLTGWGSLLAKFGGGFRATDKEIDLNLRHLSRELQQVDQEFQQMLKQSEVNLDIVCFYEELPVPGLGKIVESNATVLQGYSSYSVHGDHKNMTRFSGSKDDGYEKALAILKKWIDACDPNMTDNKSTVTSALHNYGSVYGKNVLQGQHLSGGTNTLNFN
jgi:hypothetical protein